MLVLIIKVHHETFTLSLIIKDYVTWQQSDATSFVYSQAQNFMVYTILLTADS
jgi:hypothetical protein